MPGMLASGSRPPGSLRVLPLQRGCPACHFHCSQSQCSLQMSPGMSHHNYLQAHSIGTQLIHNDIHSLHAFQ